MLKTPCKTYLLLLQIYKEVLCERSLVNLLNKILEKVPKKKFIFSTVAGSKNDFWEDCFGKPKLLLAANSLIYLNNQ